jgi:hypothetical protein
VGTLGRGEGREGVANGDPQAGDRARRGGAQAGFELGKDLLNGIEVGAVGGQREQTPPLSLAAYHALLLYPIRQCKTL